MDERYCSDCGRVTEIYVGATEAVCTTCGLVVDEDNIDNTQDVRIFDDNKDAQRVEKNQNFFNLENNELTSTVISGTGKGAQSLVRTQMKQNTNDKENKFSDLQMMTQWASLLELTDPVVQRAGRIYSYFLESGSVRRLSDTKIKALLVSSLYHAGKQLGQYKTMAEWVTVSELTQHQIYEAGTILKPHIERDVPNNCGGDEQNRNPNWLVSNCVLKQGSQVVKAFVSKLCHILKFDFRQRITAEEMAVEVVKSCNIRRKPASTAAAIVWVCSLLFDRKDCVNVIVKNSVSKKVIAATYKELLPDLERLVPTEKFGEPSDWRKKLRAP
ncbi:hypothetical protein SUGI_0901250 [Cryptomeria japonica]|uniref:transcription initiation factor IIB-2-like n=1 Tax=Cryptomeria japonica TaxID=3369 RepID=UPI0024149FF5|nr:transcription initiation factor IIB-2-like [Cryptomeria japonica]GLJ43382.1 hypothetical protein SUGI_0901250 [Cryptomeria japonica]